jgi:DNA mismatch repair protein MutL
MMSAIASVAPPRLPIDAPATQLAAQYARDLRELRERPQAMFGFDTASRQWAQQIKDRVRTSRAAEAQEAARDAAALSRTERDAAALSRTQHEQHPRAADGELSARAASAERIQSATPPAVTSDGELFMAPGDAAAPWDEARLADGSAPRAAPTFFSSLRYLGQLDLTYLLCEGDGELVLIDQHVAHERVELARLRKGHEERAIATQRLLFPTTIEVAPALVEIATRMSDMLAQVGFEAEPFGKTSLAVKSVPGAMRHGDPTQLLRKLLAEWAADGAPSEAERLDRVLAEIACHSVVRAGDRLSASEAEALLRSMDSADFVGPGPHNRPVMLRLSLADIARRFGR